MDATATLAEIERFTLRPGDVVITKDSETPDDIAVAALVEPSAEGIVCGYHLALLRPIPGCVTGPFLFWALKSREVLSQFSLRAQGVTRFGLTTGGTGEVVIPVPPINYQTQVAVFLDHETAKIDALVAEQERLIALLKEKRQAVISHAVTKGLDPNAPMKDSGVEWLGQVPAHWMVVRVKQVARLESGHTPSKQFPEYWEGGEIEWVSLNDSKHLAANDYISNTAMKITPLGMANSSARLLPEGAVVFTRDAIPRSRDNPEVRWVDDTEIICHLVAVDIPVCWHFVS